MTATARAMRMGARTITTGKQLIGQLNGPATHVGPNALTRSASYPVTTYSPPQDGGPVGPLTAVPFTADSGAALVIDGSTEFEAGGICTNWAGSPSSLGTSPPYIYNNHPSNLGGTVPSGGMKIDGFPVPAGAYVFQFMDVSWNGVSISAPAPAMVFRGCRGRGTQVPSSGFFNTGDETYTGLIFFMYCDVGGQDGGDDGPASNCIKMQQSGGFTAYRCYLSDTTTSMQPLTTTNQIDIFECFVEQLSYLNYGTGSQSHLNGITFSGGEANCRIVRNHIVIASPDVNGHPVIDTDCISFFQDSGNYPGTGTNPDGTKGYQIIGNYLGGTGFCIYPGTSGEEYAGMPPSNYNLQNNLITTSIYPIINPGSSPGGGGGYDGPIYTQPPWGMNGNTQSGNLWADGSSARTSFI